MLIQGTPEWRAARAGSLGASCMADAVARTKTGWGASRASLMGRLIAERLTGQPVETFSSAAMKWGNQVEPDARRAYCFIADTDVEQIGLVYHPTILGSHASPDGLVGEDGLLEMKCPETHTHINTLLTGVIDGRYLTQMQWQMACTGRQWVDFVSFDPRMPDEMQIWIKRVPRDQKRIVELENHATQFLKEMHEKIVKLCEKVDMPLPDWMGGSELDFAA